jgi:hypothetical protein
MPGIQGFESAHFAACVSEHEVRIVVVAHGFDCTRTRDAREAWLDSGSGYAIHRQRAVHGSVGLSTGMGATHMASNSACGWKCGSGAGSRMHPEAIRGAGESWLSQAAPTAP